MKTCNGLTHPRGDLGDLSKAAPRVAYRHRLCPRCGGSQGVGREKPLFEHDCDEGCMFLGRFEGRDLYVHPDQSCLIARNSSEGSDYSSQSIDWCPEDHLMPRLAEALRRAKDRGLLR